MTLQSVLLCITNWKLIQFNLKQISFQELETILGGRPVATPIPTDAEEVNLSEYEHNGGGPGGSRGGQYYDEDEDHHHMGGQHVQCAHQ